MQRNYFVDGPIGETTRNEILSGFDGVSGAVASFMGVVRGDSVNKDSVAGIDYSAYEEMANKSFAELEKDILCRFDIHKITILHSVGHVTTGEVSLFVVVSSKHRKESFLALEEAVELIKRDVPIWKKEILVNENCRWL